MSLPKVTQNPQKNPQHQTKEKPNKKPDYPYVDVNEISTFFFPGFISKC